MKYMVTTKEEWEDATTDLGNVFDTPEEAVEHAVQQWGSRVEELLVLHVVKAVEVKQNIEYVDYKGTDNE